MFCSGTAKKDAITKPKPRELTTKPIPLIKRIILFNTGKLYYLNNEHNILAIQCCKVKQKLNGIVQALHAGPIIEEKAFLNQTNLWVLYLPNAKTINRYGFEGYKNLKALVLASYIEYIHHEAFKWCDSKLKIVCYDICYTIPEFFTNQP